MRKRNIKTVADTIFWYALYFLPIIVCLVTLCNRSDVFWQNNVDYVDFGAWFEYFIEMFMPFGVNNPVYMALVDVFGQNGVIPVFGEGSMSILLFFTWFVNVYLAHLMVDFILFIPRIAHKWMKNCTEQE